MRETYKYVPITKAKNDLLELIRQVEKDDSTIKSRCVRPERGNGFGMKRSSGKARSNNRHGLDGEAGAALKLGSQRNEEELIRFVPC